MIKIYIDESKINNRYYLCGVAIQQVDTVRAEIKNSYNSILGDPLTHDLPLIEDFQKIGFHLTSDHPLIRNKFIDLISSLPIDSEIIVTRKNAGETIEINMLINLFKKFSRKYRFDEIQFVIEQGDLDKLIKKSLSGNPYYSQIYTISSKKDDLNLSIADYIVGIFSRYDSLTVNTLKSELAICRQNFRRISNLIRCIFDYDELLYYSRQERIKLIRGGNKFGHELVSDEKSSSQFLPASPLDIPFGSISTLDSLAQWLNLKPNLLKEFAENGISINHLKKHRFKKKNGNGYRTVYEVDDFGLELAQKVIEEALKHIQVLTLSSKVNGFIVGRSILTNARQHIGNKYLLNIDIKDFFETITYEQVFEVFKKIGAQIPISEALAKLTTYKGNLVQGFNSSPAISNLVFMKIDEQLNILSKENGVTYTRYADDLSFSSQNPITIYSGVEAILTLNGFKINDSKTIYQKRGHTIIVTGLSINDQQQPRVPNRYKKRLRMTLYNLSKKLISVSSIESLLDVTEIADKILGQIMYLNGIEPYRANQLFKEYNKLSEKIKLLAQKYRID